MNAEQNVVAAPLPPGYSIESTDELLTIVSRVSDPGEAFSIAMIGIVVLGLSFGLGARAAGSMGALIGGAIGAPLWLSLLAAALGRVVNTTKLLVKKGMVTIVTTPIALKRTRVIDDVTGTALRHATHVSSTRGSMAALKQTTWAVWLTRGGGKRDECVIFELPEEAGAKTLHAAMAHAVR